MMDKQIFNSRETGTSESKKRRYSTPVLQCFGSVTELTNAASGNCMDDGAGNTCPPDNGMLQKTTSTMG